jgi:hypothetical protein
MKTLTKPCDREFQTPIDFASISDWIVKPVDRRLALADDRYFIHYGSWFAAIQLTRDEAYRAIKLAGSSRDTETIWWAIEVAIAGGAS